MKNQKNLIQKQVVMNKSNKGRLERERIQKLRLIMLLKLNKSMSRVWIMSTRKRISQKTRHQSRIQIKI